MVRAVFVFVFLLVGGQFLVRVGVASGTCHIPTQKQHARYTSIQTPFDRTVRVDQVFYLHYFNKQRPGLVSFPPCDPTLKQKGGHISDTVLASKNLIQTLLRGLGGRQQEAKHHGIVDAYSRQLPGQGACVWERERETAIAARAGESGERHVARSVLLHRSLHPSLLRSPSQKHVPSHPTTPKPGERHDQLCVRGDQRPAGAEPVCGDRRIVSKSLFFGRRRRRCGVSDSVQEGSWDCFCLTHPTLSSPSESLFLPPTHTPATRTRNT